MSNFEVPDLDSPIEIAVNTRRFLMDGIHGELELRLRNRAHDEAFFVEVLLSGRLLPQGGSVRKLMRPAARPTQRVGLDLTGSGRSGEAAKGGERCAGVNAGDAIFDVVLNVRTSNDEVHHFEGQFDLIVLAYAETIQALTVNIGRLVEMHDKAGMGAITEVDLHDLANMSQHRTVNDWLTEEREPQFVPVELEYAGATQTPQVWQERDIQPLSRCALQQVGNPQKLFVLAKEAIVLGRDRETMDLVTWVMPRSDENDLASQHVSQKHCRLAFRSDGVWISPLSKTNPTLLDGAPIQGGIRLPLDRQVRLGLSSKFTLALTPLQISPIPSALADYVEQSCDVMLKSRWALARRLDVGGVLIERCDGFADRECYLWLLAAAAVPSCATSENLSGSGIGLLLLRDSGDRKDRPAPLLAVTPVDERKTLSLAGKSLPHAAAAHITAGDTLAVHGLTWIVGPFAQDLESRE